MGGGSQILDVNDLVRPSHIGPYRVDQLIGRGGMGVVYLGYDPKLKREVAIKAVTGHLADDPERQRRLRREAEILASVSHPNIALIYGLEIEESGSAYLIMEYVPGRTLREVLRERPLAIDEAIATCAAVAHAMEVVHNRNIIHRDLKPENIRITPRGVVKVLDFGLAVVWSPSATVDGDAPTMGHSTSLETRAAQVGTPGYMSPEQIRGLPVDHRSDVFSFGCVLYECLTRRRAFRGDSESALRESVLEDEPDWGIVPATTPGPVRDTLRRCLQRSVVERVARLGDARAALEAGLAGLRAPAAEPDRVRNPTNLPSLLSSFVGREDDVATVRTLVLESRLATLTGSGGCGKTRLALRVGEALLPEFGDGVWLVELAGITDPAAISVSLASAIGVGAPGGAAPRETDALARLRGARALIILDNCEHLLSGCRSVLDRLLRSCPQVHVLATSQAPIELPGESLFIVPSLDVPGLEEPPDAQEVLQYESVRLFVQRARASNPRFQLTNANAQTVARICRRLDGIPLAIELGAARAKVLSPEQIERLLADVFRLLTGGTESALERHRTLRATIDWSFAMLTDDERAIMQALVVFAGGWTLEAAIAVCGEAGDEYRTIDLLDRLVSKSLVAREEAPGGLPRFRLLETVRQYLRDRDGRSRAEVSERHCLYFIDLLENAEVKMSVIDDYAGIPELMAEKENLLEAQRWAFESGMSRRALRLTESLRRVWPFLSPGWKPARRPGPER